MLKPRPQGSPTFRSRSRYLEYLEFPRRRGGTGNTIGSGGNIASAFGKENMSFATGWPMRRPIAKSENDWSTAFAKCITSESSAGTVENQNGSDLIPGDEPVLARFGKAEDGSSADADADAHHRPASHRIGIAVDETHERS
jgi:hypothetical protein